MEVKAAPDMQSHTRPKSQEHTGSVVPLALDNTLNYG